MKRRFGSTTGSRARGHRGFTLIEVVVALALIGLIAVTVFESLRFGQRSYRKVIGHGGASWQTYASQRLIRSLVESAYPQQAAAAAVRPIYGIEGDAERIAITAPAPLAAGGAGLYRYEIATRLNARHKSDIVVRWSVDYASATASNADSPAEETLIEDVVAVEWSYQDDLREESESSGQQWSDDWQGRQALPRLVRLRVSFPAGDSRIWPELVMAPRITDDANCVFDVIAQRCRSAS